MNQRIEVKVPDIGDSHDVPVIELLVAVGDTVQKDQGLITLESDKATMEVPASAAGVVRELRVKVGDTLSEGAVVAVIESVATAGTATPAPAPKPAPIRVITVNAVNTLRLKLSGTESMCLVYYILWCRLGTRL